MEKILFCPSAFISCLTSRPTWADCIFLESCLDPAAWQPHTALSQPWGGVVLPSPRAARMCLQPGLCVPSQRQCQADASPALSELSLPCCPTRSCTGVSFSNKCVSGGTGQLGLWQGGPAVPNGLGEPDQLGWAGDGLTWVCGHAMRGRRWSNLEPPWATRVVHLGPKPGCYTDCSNGSRAAWHPWNAGLQHTPAWPCL